MGRLLRTDLGDVQARIVFDAAVAFSGGSRAPVHEGRRLHAVRHAVEVPHLKRQFGLGAVGGNKGEGEDERFHDTTSAFRAVAMRRRWAIPRSTQDRRGG